MRVVLVLLFLFRKLASADVKGDGESENAIRLFELGNRRMQDGDLQGAIRTYKEAIKNDASLYPIFSNLGHAHLQQNEIADAIEAYKSALQLDSSTARNWYNLGRAYQISGENSQAIDVYGKAIELDVTYANAHYNKGLAHQDEGNLEDATDSYKRVLQLQPAHTDARLNLCNILFAQHQFSVAEKCYKDVLVVDPSHVRGLVNLAAYYQATADTSADSKQQLREAMQLYERALELEPSNVMAKHGVMSLKKESGESGRGDEGVVAEGLDKGYIAELFDSYSFHFDQSLAELDYSSHLLVGEAVGKHIRLPPSVALTDNSGGMDLLGVDLGAGTGLACVPTKTSLSRRMKTLKNQRSTVDDTTLFERIGMIGVDLSKKMLQKAQQRGCYGDLVVRDITEFVEEYAAHVCGYPQNSQRPLDRNKVHIDNMSPVPQEDMHRTQVLEGSINDPTRLPRSGSVALSGVLREHSPRADILHRVGVVRPDLASTTRHPLGNTVAPDSCHRSNRDIYREGGVSTLPCAVRGASLSAEHPLLDFVIAADVFMYLGDLKAVLEASKIVLKPTGIIVFTVESLDAVTAGKCDNDDIATNGAGEKTCTNKDGPGTAAAPAANYALQPSGRIAHSRGYIESLVDALGLRILELTPAIPRKDRGRPVQGYLVVLAKE